MYAVLLRCLMRLLFRPRVVGDLAQLRGGDVVIVANHPSLIDALLIGLFLPVPVTVVVSREEMASRLLRWLLRATEHVVAHADDAQAPRRLLRLLAAGRTLALFPEGRVSRTGALMKIYDVPALVAARGAQTIVPVHIDGSQYTRFGRAPLRQRLRTRVTLTIGSATRLPAHTGVPARERRQRAVRDLQAAMQQAECAAQPRTTLFQALLAARARNGGGTRIVEELVPGPRSYGELVRVSLALGRLIARVSAEREVVGVMLPTTATTLCAVFGMSALRRIPAMLNYSAGPAALAAACANAGIRTVVSSRRFVAAARLRAATAALQGINLFYLEDLHGGMRRRDRLWTLAASLLPRSVLPKPAAPDDPAVVLFTSGSEGAPKGVALSHAGVLANVAQIRAAIDVRHDDKFLSALPLYHTYGLTACTILPLLAGARVFLYANPLHYRAIAEIAYSRDCTYLFGTGTFLAQYARAARPYDFRSVRYVICGGEKLEPEVARLWSEKFGLRIIEGYGATECGPAMTLNAPLTHRPGSVGRFLPGIETRVVPLAGAGRGGVLHVRGPNLMLGYYLREQPGVLVPPRSGLGEGWHATGDLVDIDGDGFVTILGRAKRFAKVAGEMVSLELVERIAARASPGFQHAALVQALSDRGESTVLVTTDPRLDRSRLHRAAVELGSQDLAVARRILHVPELPVLGSGKIDYVRLRELAQRSPDAGAAQAS